MKRVPPLERAAAAGVVAIGVAAYANSLSGAWVLDDQTSIVENESIRRLWPIGPVLAGTNATTVGRPLLNLTFALGRAVHGMEPAGWHAVNLVIHLLAGLALLGVARRTLLATRLAGSATALAFAIAALWTAHPLQTESVTYVCQRAESLMGLLFLTTLYCAIRGATSTRPAPWHAASITACLLGMATKEVMATAPLVVLLHDRTFAAGSFREALRRRPALYAGLASGWVLLALLVASSGGRAGSAGFESDMTASGYTLTQPRAIVTYLGLALWPHPLVLDRGARLAATAAEIVPYALLLAAFAAGTAWALVRRPALGFLGAAFLVVLAPTSSFVPLVTQTVAEHRMYVPLAAVLALVVIGVHAATQRAVSLRPALLGVALAAFVALTIVRNEEYASPRGLWEDAVALDPTNVRAQMNLGLALARDGDRAGALGRMDAAVAIDPRNAYARLLRGNLRHQAGRLDDAIADYTAAAASETRAPRALTSRGIVHLEQGRLDEALHDLDAALERSPALADALLARAEVHRARREFDLAWGDVAAARARGREPSPQALRRLAEESGRTE